MSGIALTPRNTRTLLYFVCHTVYCSQREKACVEKGWKKKNLFKNGCQLYLDPKMDFVATVT